MTLVKLDSGDYINTEAVEVINSDKSPYIGMRSNNSIYITPADRNRIVGVINGNKDEGIWCDDNTGDPIYAIVDGMRYTLVLDE